MAEYTTVKIPKALAKQGKIEAIRREVTFQDLVEEALRNELKRQPKK